MKYTKNRKYVHHHHFDNMNQMKDQKPNTQYAYVQNQDQIRC